MKTKKKLQKPITSDKSVRLQVMHANNPPIGRYNKDGQNVQYYFKDDESYRERIDKRLTLYRSIATNEIIGCQINGIEVCPDDLKKK